MKEKQTHPCNQQGAIAALETDLKLTKEFLMDITKRIEKKIDDSNDEIKELIKGMAENNDKTYVKKSELALLKQEFRSDVSVRVAAIKNWGPIVTAAVAMGIALMK